MSYHAQGWAQRQKFGSPAMKSVMQALCFLMRDEELTVYAALGKTEKQMGLEDLTEFEQRAIQKAVRQLEDDGQLQDTGERRNNITVWRMPKYEAWLARAYSESPPINEGAAISEAVESAQVDDSTAENTGSSVSEDKPPPKGGGLEQAPPLSQPSPPALVSQAPPKMGGNLVLNLSSTKPARASVRIEDWKQQARILHDRAPEKPTKDAPGTALKAHWRFWRRMVDWYGALWLVQWGHAPTAEWIRLLNLWNDSGKWTELDYLLEQLTLEKPPKPPLIGEIEQLFRTTRKATAPKFDAAAARSDWWNYTIHTLEGFAFNAELCGYKTPYSQLREDIRATLLPVCEELTVWAIREEERNPKARGRIQSLIGERITLELAKFAKPTPAERAAIAGAA